MQERFTEKLRKLRMPHGINISGIESAITFLESDSWFFGSGYFKADLLKVLTQVELKPVYTTRLQKVVIAIVDKRDCREFRWYCRLGSKVQSATLIDELQRRLNSTDENIQRRARWMLEWINKYSYQNRKK